MDIISLGKANKVFRNIKNLDEDVVAKKAESRFLNVDARLDWIEQQASSIMAENSHEVDLSKKTFDEVKFVDESVQLRELSPGNYVGSGSWESDVVDLGEGWQDTKSIQVNITI